jgi:hypothetical protein
MPLLGWKSATFVSLQYGDIQKDLETLRELTGGRVIHDTEINQLVDLDGFAAQIAALDGVISISNTTIDMAGMLGVPTVHIPMTICLQRSGRDRVLRPGIPI